MSLFTSGDNGTFDTTTDPNGNPPSDWNITKSADSIVEFNDTTPITGTGSMHCETNPPFNIETISPQYLWHKFEPNTFISGVSNDSLNTNTYNLNPVFNNLSLSILDNKYGVDFDGDSSVMETSVDSNLFFSQSFSFSIQIAPLEGNPITTNVIVHSYDGTAGNRFSLNLLPDGKIQIQLGSGGNSVAISTANPIFTSGQSITFTSIIITCESQGAIKMYINGVETSLTSNDISTINLNLFAANDPLRLGARKAATYDTFYRGLIRQFSIQPVIYTLQQVIDVSEI